jgi:phospholipid/cholesterol/gamma-HCH transport system substrate-binding protein
MKDEKKTEIKVGITVLIALLALIWIIGWAKNSSLASARETLTVRFGSVSGLSVGDQVTVNGVKKGYVDAITVEQSTVLVRLSIDPDVKLKDDAAFNVEMLDLMGGKKVEITPGESAANLDLNKIAQGDFAADIPYVMKTVGHMTKELPRMLKSLDSTMSMVNKMLTDEMASQNLKTSLTELKNITIKVNDLLDKNSAQITTLVANSNKLVTDTKDVLNSNKADISATIKQASELTQNANKIITKLDSFMGETRDQKNNLGKLLYNDSLLVQIKELTGSLQQTVNVLNTQLTGKGVNVRAKIDLF